VQPGNAFTGSEREERIRGYLAVTSSNDRKSEWGADYRGYRRKDDGPDGRCAQLVTRWQRGETVWRTGPITLVPIKRRLKAAFGTAAYIIFYSGPKNPREVGARKG
jgi:hypothetical protein